MLFSRIQSRDGLSLIPRLRHPLLSQISGLFSCQAAL